MLLGEKSMNTKIARGCRAARAGRQFASAFLHPLGAVTGVVGALTVATAALAQSSELRMFLATYRCAVVERLELIYQHPAPRDRFLALALSNGPRGYVQCIFLEDNTKMLCEAESGYYADLPGRPRSFRVTPQGLAALARLGFSTEDWDGNHQLMMDIRGPDDFAAVADTILSALYDAYGARLGSHMHWTSPLAQQPNAASSRCTPIG